MKLTEVPMSKLMEALPKMSRGIEGEELIFNLVTDIDGDRVPNANWHMKFNTDGTIECGEEHLEGADAITFVLKQGGVNTMLGFMLDGLSGGPRSAMMSMMMGKIAIEPFNPKNVKVTEGFFKRVETGEESLTKAAAEIGVVIDEIDV
jgi:hypothetical protein